MNLNERIEADRRLLSHLGIEVDAEVLARSASDQGPLLSMLVNDNMVNALGFCHGGLVYALADTACAYALGDRGIAPATLDASVTYLKPARLGDRISAHTQVLKAGKRTGHCEVRIKSDKGDTLAVYRGTCANVNA